VRSCAPIVAVIVITGLGVTIDLYQPIQHLIPLEAARLCKSVGYGQPFGASWF
jgi:hypothetical protein